MASNGSLVTVSPAAVIPFSLSRDAQAKSSLVIKNVSTAKVVFKVKTTQPQWYYVRPNQQVLDLDQAEEVSIILSDAECNRILELPEGDRDDIIDKHRFLVQSKIIDDATFEKLKNLSPNARADELQRIWESNGKEEKKNNKLKVEFHYPDNESAEASSVHNDIPSISQNIDNVRSRLTKVATSPKKQMDENPGSPEAIFAELQALRKKYDAVVEYTVHLTAERDYHLAQLEDLRKEYSKEKSKKKLADAPKKYDKSNEKKIEQQGFSLLVVIVVALIAFLVARFIKV